MEGGPLGVSLSFSFSFSHPFNQLLVSWNISVSSEVYRYMCHSRKDEGEGGGILDEWKGGC
jgi:hypothetical protein